MLEFDGGGYEPTCIFTEKLDDKDGWICPEGLGRKEQQIHMSDDWYCLIRLALPQSDTYRIRYKGVSLVQMYLSGGSDSMERRMRFLGPNSGDETGLEKWYDTSVREQYRFDPFMDWANDPNGLCWSKGCYHLSYQSSLFRQEWSDMYWGHTISRDLLH